MNLREDKMIQQEGKPRLILTPRKIIAAIARVREFGDEKHKGTDNWKLRDKHYFQNKAYRHFMAYLDDNESVDEESGLPHLHHLAANIAFLIEGGYKE